jgi:hypothetical protein
LIVNLFGDGIGSLRREFGEGLGGEEIGMVVCKFTNTLGYVYSMGRIKF